MRKLNTLLKDVDASKLLLIPSIAVLVGGVGRLRTQNNISTELLECVSEDGECSDSDIDSNEFNESLQEHLKVMHSRLNTQKDSFLIKHEQAETMLSYLMTQEGYALSDELLRADKRGNHLNNQARTVDSLIQSRYRYARDTYDTTGLNKLSVQIDSTMTEPVD